MDHKTNMVLIFIMFILAILLGSLGVVVGLTIKNNNDINDLRASVIDVAEKIDHIQNEFEFVTTE